ncbi:hypothetical protein BC835DRAFT_1420367 [Cytidiella melzeri]|nr:hypothetical protein BC835DRAFT_1420367 [Cytidiella melzeri]
MRFPTTSMLFTTIVTGTLYTVAVAALPYSPVNNNNAVQPSVPVLHGRSDLPVDAQPIAVYGGFDKQTLQHRALGPRAGPGEVVAAGVQLSVPSTQGVDLPRLDKALKRVKLDTNGAAQGVEFPGKSIFRDSTKRPRPQEDKEGKEGKEGKRPKTR